MTIGRGAAEVIVAAGALACFLIVAEPASASCAAPSANINPSRGARGHTLTVTGKYFAANCPDVIACTPAGVCETPKTLPTKDIPIDFVQGKNIWRLAVVNGLDFSVEIRVPFGARPGSATVSVGGGCDGDRCLLPLTVTAAAPEIKPGEVIPPPDAPAPDHGSAIILWSVSAVGTAAAASALLRRVGVR